MRFSSKPRPARYLPFDKGVYEVAPGLRPFGTDFGNGELDSKVIQFDSDSARYLHNKEACRKENIAKYCLESRFTESIAQHTCGFIAHRLAQEYPGDFAIRSTESEIQLDCSTIDETLVFDTKFRLRTPGKYRNAFDALCSQIPEDVAVITLDPTNGNYLSSIHLCAAGHWSPAAKVGRDFFAIHQPVAHIEKINERSQQFAEVMVQKGPFVRFAWGFSTDTRLNHHPDPPPGVSHDEWTGRSFSDPRTDRLFVRVERQVMWGLPEAQSALFFIRVSYLEGEELRRDPRSRASLRAALASMSPQSLAYKGLTNSIPALLEYLKD